MSLLKQLRFVGILEAVSFILLIGVCMPLKHIYNVPEPTRYIGMAHGLFFIVYCSYVMWLGAKFNWSNKVIFLGLLASVIPFGPFWAEKKLFPIQN